jgi:hypothetical protein
VPEAPFNPLEKRNLAESIERELLSRPCIPLAPSTFPGAGIYAIYYSGAFAPYAPISGPECELPIYVGKAVPAGSRRGGFLDAVPGNALSNRLRDHAASVSAATNLEADAFRCRYLLVDDIWIPLGEALLISHFKPVWNQVIDGFGKHASGAGRTGGRRSMWDELHPGRPWATGEQPATRTVAELTELIAAFFGQGPELTLDAIEP